ncbi:hypothetical protein OGV36_11665 [Citrobacter sp. Cb008]|jgi:ABC-type amino acid transport substrate-binding protein|uniref:hypothetical protein n=1 Tax=Citrobacter TaxID=544 RepID=UPI0006661346|nr:MULTISPECIES: hypothetical protein [Citrobacter]AUV25901.1 hypothetical protein C2U38_09835 [Citrobacter freundii complex sp. CFNIH3]MBA7759042.1 hypothetical protein [Citrobacter sp. RHBSTW-00325]MBJ8820835.1 hypothetical protein [Citrobacter braakii]MBJ9225234.1 hypothetical protein [Citrobacter braakii]MBJ9264510.1 hypothetical protein [Citrobacter braakii]
MKLPPVFSCAVLVLLLASSSAAASALQNQAAREQELSAALLAGNGVIIIGGTDDFAFTFRARNRIHRHLAIQDGIGDPIMMNGFQDHNYNPARDGFINNPARGRFMFNAPIRR